MAYGAGHELTWNIAGGKTLYRRVITWENITEKDILSSGELLRAYQGCEDTICYYYYYYYYILEHNFDISSPSKEFDAFSQIKTYDTNIGIRAFT